MSARTRELFGLLPVSLLVAAGFAAVLILAEDVSDATLTYGAVFLGLCVVAHLFIRARLQDADPYLFPLVALLAAIGPDLPHRPGARARAGAVVRGGPDLLLRHDRIARPPRAGALPLHDRGGRDRPARDAAAAGIGAQVNGAFLAINVGPIQFQPAEFAKLGIIVFLASYLRETGDILVRRGCGRCRSSGQLCSTGCPRRWRCSRSFSRPGTARPCCSRFVASLVAVLRERPSPKHFGPLLLVWGRRC